MESSIRRFNGFSQEAVNFLNEIKENNNKVWFENNKIIYTTYLLSSMQDLAYDLSSIVLKIDPYFETGANTVSKIYRDTRFSKIKTPYKETMWVTFKRRQSNWMDAPAYFFEITADYYRYGMGFYCASPATMRKMRWSMDNDEQTFREAIAFYGKQNIFEIEGDFYKKILDKNKPLEIQKWYQRKNIYLVCNRAIDRQLFSAKLVDELEEKFIMLAPLYHYLQGLTQQ